MVFVGVEVGTLVVVEVVEVGVVGEISGGISVLVPE